MRLPGVVAAPGAQTATSHNGSEGERPAPGANHVGFRARLGNFSKPGAQSTIQRPKIMKIPRLRMAAAWLTDLGLENSSRANCDH